jgi:hypothetical protein
METQTITSSISNLGNNLSQAQIDINNSPTIPSISIMEQSSGPVFEWSSINMTKIVILIVILSFLGVNLLTYLGITMQKITDFIKDLFSDIMRVFGVKDAAKTVVQTTGNVAKTGIDITAGAAKSGINVAAGVTTSGVDTLQKTVGVSPNQTKQSSAKTATVSPQTNKDGDNVKPDTASSTIQTPGAGGFCNVGSWKGIRSCIKVGDSTKCMSGDIFPTKEICINPSLRQ